MRWFTKLNRVIQLPPRSHRQTARPFAHSRLGTFESLESRSMLSVAGDDMPTLDDYFTPRGALVARITDPPSPAPEAKEEKVAAIDPISDHGDYYWGDGVRVPLLRRDDEVLVAFKPAVNKESALTRIAANNGALAELVAVRRLTAEFVIYRRASSTALDEAARQSLADDADVAWVGPVFVSAESRERFVITNQLVVSVPEGIDVHDVVGKSDASNSRFVPGQWLVTLTNGGSLETLHLANELHDDSRVGWSTPDAYPDFRTQTNDTLFNRQWTVHNTGQLVDSAIFPLPGQADADGDVQEA
jgi:hypothetical protein